MACGTAKKSSSKTSKKTTKKKEISFKTKQTRGK